MILPKGVRKTMMNGKQIRENLRNHNYDVFGDDLEFERQCFGRYDTIEEMLETENASDSFWQFLVEDFPNKYSV